jgi:predicted adenylyl cyclase CyaB
MPRNVEIKARLTDGEAQRARAAQLSDAPPQMIVQEDVFFNVPQGRLKLRFVSPTQGQLIFYQRRDDSGPTTSTYELFDTDQPQRLQAVLAAAYGIRNIVRKTRQLYWVGRTRIHIDEVESLGHFLELEVVLTDTEAPAAGVREARELMQQLGVADAQLVSEAYVDLLPSYRPSFQPLYARDDIDERRH